MNFYELFYIVVYETIKIGHCTHRYDQFIARLLRPPCLSAIFISHIRCSVFTDNFMFELYSDIGW